MSAPFKSRPTYPGLRPILTARRNVVVADAAGTEAVARLLVAAPDDFATRTEVLVVGPADQDRTVRRLEGMGASVSVLPGIEALLDGLDARLDTATMGTRLYVAGSESLVGRVVRQGIDHAIDPRSVLTEHAGSLARRVQCVHCKTTTEAVTTSLFECSGCELLLLVRDHFSSRLAAFQGVCVNAEDPGERPTPEEVFG